MRQSRGSSSPPGRPERASALGTLLSEHGLKIARRRVEGFADALGAAGHGVTSLAVLGLEQGFQRRPSWPSSPSRTFSATASCVRAARLARAADVLNRGDKSSVGDLRRARRSWHQAASPALKTITALGAPHDCLELKYAGGDTLYLPVENIELLSRYRRRRRRRAARQARRRRLAVAQGPPQEAPARDRLSS